MCHQNSSCVSSEESTAEESLLIYCKPVELYNILQCRARENPLFLGRCLRYKIQEKNKRRMRPGNVIFNYNGYNKMIRKSEVTEGFSCPFCLMQCASFKGLRFHLCSSHDLFSYEFWVTEDYQVVNVSVKTDCIDSEITVDGIHLWQHSFFFCSKRRTRKMSNNLTPNSGNVHPLAMPLDSPMLEIENVLPNASDVNIDVPVEPAAEIEKAVILSHNDSETQNATHEDIAAAMAECDLENGRGNDSAQPSTVQSTRARKLAVDQLASRNRLLLQKRQFFHSHRAQPMSLDQVLSDCDSEDEVDHEIADFEDQRMLDDFVDVTKDEKRFMHLWNSFVRRQRVLADGHIPWACRAFSKLNGQEFVKVPSLFWCWKLFMIKLWNHGLLDAATMNECSLILEGYKKGGLDAKST